MDVVRLIELFKGTVDQSNDNAEQQLEQIHKIIGFLPAVLHIVMESSIDMPVRQAAVIYFKNEVSKYWIEKECKNNSLPFSVHENDRVLIRNSIVDALVMSPTEMIRNNLAVALNYIIKNDFPQRWTGCIEKIVFYLQTAEPNNLTGALIAMLQLAKNYEYKNNEEKAPLLDAMKVLGPLQYKIMCQLMADNSEQSVLMQKIILKTIFIMTQYSLPLSLFTEEVFTQWMEIIRQVLDRPIPNEVNNVDIDERPELPWFKAKKWALHIIVRIFERYGPKKGQSKEYMAFGRWYVDTFSMGFIQVILKMLDQYSQKVYLPPRVLQQCINYLDTSVENIHTWKILKPNISQIFERVIFPLMCYTDEDDELWNTDPQEYVRRKFDFFEDYVSPVSAAQQFLSTCCRKRKDMLKNTIAFAVQVLSADSTPQFKDGALHILGSVSDIMLKKKIYQSQVDHMLGHYVFPYFICDHPFLRARAAWILHFFEDFEFKNDVTLNQALICLQNALINDKELPIKVQAAISLHILVTKQEKAKAMIEPNLNSIILECLNLIKLSQNDDVTNGLQRIICYFGDSIKPIAVQIMEKLVIVLEQLLETNDEDNNDNTITIMGLLNTIDTILMLVNQPELEPYALRSVLAVLNGNLSELYEESFNIVTTLTEKHITNDTWKVYEYIFQISTKDDGVDYFPDMLPALHNFLTVDPDAFIADPNRIHALYEICKYVMHFDCIEDIHCNAVKMIEVLFLQFREKIATCMPLFCELAFEKIMCPTVQTEELRNLCIQVMLCVLYINTDLFFKIMEGLQQKYPNNQDVLGHFFKEWLTNLRTFFGLHDRKVCILALSTLLALPENKLPVMREMGPKIMPDLLQMFDNLKEAYKAKAKAEAESSDDSSEYTLPSDEEDAIEDEEEMDETESLDNDEDDEFSDDENELTSLENFETTIDKDDSDDDEYIIFWKTVEFLKMHDMNFYNNLFSDLNPTQIATLEDIFQLAQRRRDAAESRKIERRGGYFFANQTIPTTFNFGGVTTTQDAKSFS